MVKPVNLYSATSGLNTRLDPQRLSQGTEDNPGLIELSQAVNVSIDDRGLVELRTGSSSLSGNSYHSLFCNGGDCFVIQERTSDAAILQVLTVSPFTTATVAMGLAKGLRMAWGQAGGDTFYSNAVQKGYIRAGVRYDWPVHTYNGPDADMQFATAIPAVSHIAFMAGGQLLIAVGSAIFSNHLPYQYGLFSPGAGNVASFPSDVQMIAAVDGGFFASDETDTWFFRRTENWYLFQQQHVENAPALLGSLSHDRVRLSDAGFESQGFGRMWASTKGICIGGASGLFANLTEEKVNCPGGYSSGASLIKDKVVIHTAA